MPLLAGANVLTVTARDVAHKTPTATLTVTFTDTQAPAISVTSPASGTTTTAVSVSVAGTASDAGGLASITWRNDRGGTGVATGTTAWTASVPLRSGANVLTFTANDAAGNTSSTTLAITSTPAPGSFGPVSPEGATGTRTPTFQWNPSASAALYRLLVDDAQQPGRIALTLTPAEAGCATAGTFCRVSPGTVLAVGAGQWWIGLTSAGGNGSWAEPLAFVVQDIPPDTTAPSVSITEPTTTATYDTLSPTVAVAGVASDTDSPITAVTWSNDRGGVGIAEGTDAWSIASVPLRVGANVLTVTARDEANNTATATLTVTYTDRSPEIVPPGTRAMRKGRTSRSRSWPAIPTARRR